MERMLRKFLRLGSAPLVVALSNTLNCLQEGDPKAKEVETCSGCVRGHHGHPALCPANLAKPYSKKDYAYWSKQIEGFQVRWLKPYGRGKPHKGFSKKQ